MRACATLLGALPRPTPRCSHPSPSTPPASQTTAATTSWSSSATYRSIRSASTTCCRSWGWRTWATSPASGFWASRSWRASSTTSGATSRCRSGGRPRSRAGLSGSSARGGSRGARGRAHVHVAARRREARRPNGHIGAPWPPARGSAQPTGVPRADRQGRAWLAEAEHSSRGPGKRRAVAV